MADLQDDHEFGCPYCMAANTIGIDAAYVSVDVRQENE
jgi:hypothetical protein